MDTAILLFVGLLSGVCAALGIGGGFVLLIYLTAVISTNQFEAQLLNLLFFIPVGLLSMILHIKHKLVVKEIAAPAIIGGIVGAVLGVLVACVFKAGVISKIFALFILLIGIFQLKSGFKKSRAE